MGLGIFMAGGAVVVFHQKIADNLASGISSYDRVKLFGLIGSGVGLLIMMNLHTWVLRLFVSLIIK